MLIGINAQKLFVTQDYRNAGISRYIGRLTRHLPEVRGRSASSCIPTGTSPAGRGGGPRLRLAPARTPTTHPLLRILWEQTVLPALALRDGVDLLHRPLNVRPVLAGVVVLTIHDLTFVRFPDRFHPLKQRYLALTRFSARRARASRPTQRDEADVEEMFGIPSARVDVVYPGVDEDFRPYDPGDATDRRA